MSDLHSFVTVFCEHCGYTISVPVYCKNRFCRICNVHRNRLVRFKLKEFLRIMELRKHDSFKFLTLTVSDQPNVSQMTTELITAFRRLRQRSFWRKNVRGGCTVIEVKRGKDAWHVHLHIIIESGYLPFKVLLEEWKAVSSGQGVFIKKIHNSQVIGYITKYLTKDDVPEKDQKFMTVVLKGRRLFQSFGSWFKPMASIRKLSFNCPDCNKTHWFFGNRNAWLRTTTEQCIDYKRAREQLPVLSRSQQTTFVSSIGSRLHPDLQ